MRNKETAGLLLRPATVAVAAAAACLATWAVTHSATAAPRDCFAELAHGRAPSLVCEFPTALAQKERDDLKALTREAIRDARCVVSIAIERRLVEDALRSPDHVFEAPPLPVTCTIETSATPYVITGTFAPRVVLRDGFAVEAVPNLANVAGTGAAAYLAWPVVQYVNRAPHIQVEMRRIINAYLAAIRTGRHRAARS